VDVSTFRRCPSVVIFVCPVTLEKGEQIMSSTNPPPTPEFASISGWMALTGMKRSKTYEEIGAGHLPAVKHGSRTLVDVRAGLEWLRGLPAAKVKAPPSAEPGACTPKMDDAPAGRRNPRALMSSAKHPGRRPPAGDPNNARAARRRQV
jgi:hypothetical protein